MTSLTPLVSFQVVSRLNTILGKRELQKTPAPPGELSSSTRSSLSILHRIDWSECGGKGIRLGKTKGGFLSRLSHVMSYQTRDGAPVDILVTGEV